eukprot:SAG22_NODE_76_length_22248_cov_14.352070_15_plen_307_part_00
MGPTVAPKELDTPQGVYFPPKDSPAKPASLRPQLPRLGLGGTAMHSAHVQLATGFGAGVAAAAAAAAVAWQACFVGDDPRVYTLKSGTAVHLVRNMNELGRVSVTMLARIQDELAEAAAAGGGAASGVVVVGLDTEWAANEEVALVQLAVGGLCLLVHVHALRQALPAPAATAAAAAVQTGDSATSAGHLLPEWPPAFVQLMTHPAVIFTGSAVPHDAKLIHEQLGIDCRAACVDLQVVARGEQLHKENGIGLQGLALTVLGQHLSKDPHVRCGEQKGLPSRLTYQVLPARSMCLLALSLAGVRHA